MTYFATQSETFRDHFIDLPKSLQKRVSRAIGIIEATPDNIANKNIEHLKEVPCWTYHFSEGHRILYSIHAPNLVHLIDVGTHDHIYNHVVPTQRQVDEEYGGAAVIEAVLNPASPMTAAQAPKWPQRRPAPVQRSVHSGKLLPMRISPEVLKRLDIPLVYHEALCAAETDDDLDAIGLPEEIYAPIFTWLYDQPTLAEIAQQPTYVLQNPEDLERFADGSLLGFLLYLDPEQKSLTDFSLKGPTLVKGGPGSGKSTVALYRIKTLVEQDYLAGMQPRILFTTFTKTLIAASRQLLGQLLGSDEELMSYVTISTLDGMAWKIVTGTGDGRPTMAERGDWQAALNSARAAFHDDRYAQEQQLLNPVGRFRDTYLMDEMEWVIEGQGIETLEAYLGVPRRGRTFALNATQRRAMWAIYDHVRQYFEANHLMTWSALRRQAIQAIETGRWTEQYDYVVVDEAQDLTPLGLALCLRLCRTPAGLFLTADASQSLYNRGFSWNRVHEDLRVAGRTRILKRNYRTTRQVAEAAHHFLHGTGAGDDEALAQNFVHTGPRPKVYLAPDRAAEFDWLREQIYAATREIRQGLEAVAVLVPSHDLLRDVVTELARRELRYEVVEPNNPLNLTSPAVKVMTIHSAKGLEFPIVFLPCLDEGRLPRHIEMTEDYAEKMAEQKRLFYVACTRAMYRLYVTASRRAPSPFVTQLDRDFWQFDEDGAL